MRKCTEMFYMCLRDDHHEKGERNDDGEERVVIAESVSSADERGGNLCRNGETWIHTSPMSRDVYL